MPLRSPNAYKHSPNDSIGVAWIKTTLGDSWAKFGDFDGGYHRLAKTGRQPWQAMLGPNNISGDYLDDFKNASNKLLPFHRLTWGRRLFKSRKGFIGLAPRTCMVDDVIVVFSRATVPMMIHEATGGPTDIVDNSATQGKEDRVYILQGDCYVHGLMDGQVEGLLQRGEVEKIDVVIR